MGRSIPRIARALPQHQRKQNDRLRPKHLAFIRLLICVACGAPTPSQAAHVRMSRAGVGKVNAMSAKPADRFAVPLCARCHMQDQHTKEGEPAFWARLGIDPVDLSLRLYSVTGDMEQGERAVLRARQSIALHRNGHA